MATTTANCASWKVEEFSAAHCYLATQSALACTNTSGQQTLTGMASTAAIAVGMAVTGTGVPANTVVSRILSNTSIEISHPTTSNVSSITVTGDTFMMALVKATPTTGTYGSGTTNYANLTGNSDEVSGTGYTAGGVALTNTSPALTSGVIASITFGNPQWTGATFTTSAGIIYNASARLGAASAAAITGRAASTHDFGGNQTVSAGTLTVLMPSNVGATAIESIS